MKSGFVAILGRPNVGKSTFLNAILSKKVSIVSPKPQTTRDNILGILTEKDYQMVFIDTPGLFEGEGALDRFMNKEARSSLADADVVLYIIAADSKDNETDFKTLKALKLNCPFLLLVNKIDLMRAPEMETLLTKIAEAFPRTKVLQMSALTNFGLKDIKDEVAHLLPEGPLYFEKESITDKGTAFAIKETIRYELLHFLSDEVPHQAAVTIDSLREKEKELFAEATIFVEKKSQIGIVVGKNGEMIKKISMSARHELERRLHKHVDLRVEVRYAPEWRNKSDKLREFGYSKDQ